MTKQGIDTAVQEIRLNVQGYGSIVQLDEVQLALVRLAQQKMEVSQVAAMAHAPPRPTSRAVLTQPQRLTVCPTMLFPMSSAATMRLISVRPPTQLL